MNEQGQNEIKEMAKVLGSEYSKYAFDSLVYANKKLDTFASLLIAIAFSSIGLSAQLLKNSDLNTEIIRWGIIFLAISIIFGLAQLIIDREFFMKAHKLYDDIGSKFGLISTGVFNNTDVQEALNTLEKHKIMPASSNVYSLVIEFSLVFVGDILILHQLLL